MTLVRGIDISSWQHADNKPIDFHAVKSHGISFVMVKATQGTNYVNPWLKEDLDSAAMAGVLTGAYHFFESGPTPNEQAEYFVAALMGHFLDLGVWLDFEIPVTNKFGDAQAATEFISVVEQTRRPCGIYTTPDVLAELKEGTFKPSRWWAADWGVPHAPAGCFLWQTGQETVPGIEGEVDADRLIATHGIDIPTSPAMPKPAEAPVRPVETPKVEEVATDEPQGSDESPPSGQPVPEPVAP